jgi:hypothetical protein
MEPVQYFTDSYFLSQYICILYIQLYEKKKKRASELGRFAQDIRGRLSFAAYPPPML